MTQERTFIKLDERQAAALRAIAKERGIALWKLVDEIIVDYLAKHSEWGK